MIYSTVFHSSHSTRKHGKLRNSFFTLLRTKKKSNYWAREFICNVRWRSLGCHRTVKVHDVDVKTCPDDEDGAMQLKAPKLVSGPWVETALSNCPFQGQEWTLKLNLKTTRLVESSGTCWKAQGPWVEIVLSHVFVSGFIIFYLRSLLELFLILYVHLLLCFLNCQVWFSILWAAVCIWNTADWKHHIWLRSLSVL